MLQRFARAVSDNTVTPIMILLLAVFMPPLNWLAVVVLSLVTLEHGWQRGAKLMLWYIAFNLLLAQMFSLSTTYQLIAVFYGGIFTLLLAMILRSTHSWSLLLTFCAVLGVLGVLGVHLAVDDIATYWYNESLISLGKFQALSQVSMKIDDIHRMASQTSLFATGTQFTLAMAATLSSLAAARWLQAKRYESAGFAQEWSQLRVNWLDISLLFAIGATSVLLTSSAYDALPPVFLPLLPTGLLVAHRYLNTLAYRRWLLATFYVFLVIAFPYMLLALSLLAVADSISRGRQDGSYSIRNRT